jgi:CSLREA domain-containing protein
MKQTIPRRPNLSILIVASLCLGLLLIAMFRVSPAKAVGVGSPQNTIWRALDQPTLAAGPTLTVNTLGDAADAFIGNGQCDTDQTTAGDQCTLRAAIQEANAVFGDETIGFSVTGTINLTGVLPNITSNMSINGPGSGMLTVRRDTGGDYPSSPAADQPSASLG